MMSPLPSPPQSPTTTTTTTVTNNNTTALASASAFDDAAAAPHHHDEKPALSSTTSLSIPLSPKGGEASNGGMNDAHHHHPYNDDSVDDKPPSSVIATAYQHQHQQPQHHQHKRHHHHHHHHHHHLYSPSFFFMLFCKACGVVRHARTFLAVVTIASWVCFRFVQESNLLQVLEDELDHKSVLDDDDIYGTASSSNAMKVLRNAKSLRYLTSTSLSRQRQQQLEEQGQEHDDEDDDDDDDDASEDTLLASIQQAPPAQAVLAASGIAAARMTTRRLVGSTSTEKSCRYNPSGSPSYWECQECNAHGECHSITHQRRHKCNSFPRNQWDEIPRFQLQYYDDADAHVIDYYDGTTPAVTTNPLIPKRSLSYWSMPHEYIYEAQPMCTMESCWDLSRCQQLLTNDDNNNTLTVYLNETKPYANLQYAQQNAKYVNIQQVDDPNQACLILVRPATYNTPSELQASKHWTSSSSSSIYPGQNHLFWELEHYVSKYKSQWHDTNDSPFHLFHIGYMAIASPLLTTAYIRWNYDIPLAQTRMWGRPLPAWKLGLIQTTTTTTTHTTKKNLNHHIHPWPPRRWLLSFRGTVRDYWIPYYQHRWLAGEYWNLHMSSIQPLDKHHHLKENDDIFVDIQCFHKKPWALRKVTPYDHPESLGVYDEIMMNSTFAFAPGANGPTSHRFAEYLSTGTIPVVVQGDFVPPLAPEIDWSSCVVYVPESRIIDLPNILRQMSLEEIQQRQQHCWHLFQTIIGDRPITISGTGGGRTTKEQPKEVWVQDGRLQFTKALEIVAARIRNAHHKLQQQEAFFGK